MNSFDRIFEELFQGIAKGMTLEDLAKKHKCELDVLKKQLEKGKKVEMEHTKDEQLATKIAMDHLYEMPDYYDKLKQVESK